MAEFKLNGQSYLAERAPAPFVCKIDGMKLPGMGMDWCITRADGQKFPLPDHIFKLLFEPIDDEAKKLFSANYSLRVGFGEKVSVLDRVEALLGRKKNIQ